MALPPTIPTSFVPRESVSHRQLRTNYTGVFGVFAYLVFGITVLLAVGVFFYDRILASTQAAQETSLAKAEAAIDPATVESFVKLRDRLNESQKLLKEHVAFSNFFTVLGALLPTNVRFTLLHIAVDSSGNAKVEGNGTAKNFNALAAASAAFAGEPRIKDVIFSKININKDSSVSFGFSATLDPRLIMFTPDSYAATAAATTSAATTTSP